MTSDCIHKCFECGKTLTIYFKLGLMTLCKECYIIQIKDIS